jgi:hypothetical protein
VATDAAGARFRDPDHVAARYFFAVGAAVVLLVCLDVAIRAARATGTRRPSRAAMRAVRQARWTPRRMVVAGGALLSFYVTYLSYRNLKGTLPLLRDDLFDRQLAALDRDLFLGHDPADLLHGLLGTGGLPTHVLSTFYAVFIIFLPLCLGLALVFSPDLPTSLFFTTALSLNWLLGSAATSSCRRSGRCTPTPGRSPSSPTPRSRGCRRCCSTTASRTCAIRTTARRRPSPPSPRSTSR